jgi:hypothetical protein
LYNFEAGNYSVVLELSLPALLDLGLERELPE